MHHGRRLCSTMLPSIPTTDKRDLNNKLYTSLLRVTVAVDDLTRTMFDAKSYTKLYALRSPISFSRATAYQGDSNAGVLQAFGAWLRAHENAQVMIASVLVVLAIWWLVRCVLSLLINLVFPILVVLLAVVCVPQLRNPLLGQNYPLVANIMRNILLKLAENMKTS